jgi:(R,R)-butanediol dehydrogenase / meso-butanediol dehydrogenase / diacetyl reductase
VPRRLIAPFSDPELRSLLALADERERALALVLLDTGLRLSELAPLRVGDVRPDGTLHVMGKGSKDEERAQLGPVREVADERREELTPDSATRSSSTTRGGLASAALPEPRAPLSGRPNGRDSILTAGHCRTNRDAIRWRRALCPRDAVVDPVEEEQMIGAQLYGHEDLRVEEVPYPSPAPGWSIVQVLASAICHSDLREFQGPSYIGRTGLPNPITGVYLPVILGHEFSGRVVEMNGTHPTITVGDKVVPDGCIYDQTCWYCRNGMYNLCEAGGVLGFDGHGSHAEFVAVPNYALFKLPEIVDDEQGALIEPLSVAVHALRQGRLGVGDTVAIAGAGMIGLCALAAAQASGAGKVIVAEPLPGRRQRAKAMGATVIDPADGDTGEQVRALTDGRGAEIALECVGAASALDSAMAMTRRAGRVVMVGLYTSKITVDIAKAQLVERELVGSLAYAWDFPRAISLVADGRVNLSGFVTGRIGLREIVTAGFGRMETEADKHLRIVINTQQV